MNDDTNVCQLPPELLAVDSPTTHKAIIATTNSNNHNAVVYTVLCRCVLDRSIVIIVLLPRLEKLCAGMIHRLHTRLSYGNDLTGLC